MIYYFVKVVVSACLIVLISELAKKYTFLSAVLASLPLVSILAMTWLYIDERNLQKVSALSTGIFWMVIPSLLFFLAFPLMVKLGMNFIVSLLVSSALTALTYRGYLYLLKQWGIEI